MTASRFGLTELVKLLLELGADTTLKHKSGKRAFELACFEITDKSKVKEIQTLLDVLFIFGVSISISNLILFW